MWPMRASPYRTTICVAEATSSRRPARSLTQRLPRRFPAIPLSSSNFRTDSVPNSTSAEVPDGFAAVSGGGCTGTHAAYVPTNNGDEFLSVGEADAQYRRGLKFPYDVTYMSGSGGEQLQLSPLGAVGGLNYAWQIEPAIQLRPSPPVYPPPVPTPPSPPPASAPPAPTTACGAPSGQVTGAEAAGLGGSGDERAAAPAHHHDRLPAALCRVRQGPRRRWTSAGGRHGLHHRSQRRRRCAGPGRHGENGHARPLFLCVAGGLLAAAVADL